MTVVKVKLCLGVRNLTGTNTIRKLTVKIGLPHIRITIMLAIMKTITIAEILMVMPTVLGAFCQISVRLGTRTKETEGDIDFLEIKPHLHVIMAYAKI